MALKAALQNQNTKIQLRSIHINFKVCAHSSHRLLISKVIQASEN